MIIKLIPASIPIHVALLTLVACAGPERAPHQPIKGVDTEQNQVDNPFDREDRAGHGAAEDAREEAPARREETATAQASFLDGFLEQVAAAHGKKPGIIAIFPALTRTPDRRTKHVNGLGEHLMQETAEGLEREGIKSVIAGAGLKNDLLAAGTGLRALHDTSDVYALGSKIGADYIVFGTVERKVFDRLKGDEILQIDWVCKRTSDRATVAAYRRKLEQGGLSRRLMRYYRIDSGWRIGDDVAK